MITANASMRTRKREYIPTTEWNSRIDALIQQGELDIQFLVLRVELSADGAPPVVFEDIMEPLLQNLCLHSLQKLLADEAYQLDYWDYPGSVDMTPQGDEIHLVGDLVDPVNFPKQGLCKALLDCGGQVLTLMRTLATNYPDYDGSAFAYFEELYAENFDKYVLMFGQR